MKRSLLICAALAVAIAASAQNSEASLEAAPEGEQASGPASGPSVYGYILNAANGSYGDEPGIGNSLTFRLKADWNPSERLSFKTEIRVQGNYGAANATVRAASFGMTSALGSALAGLGAALPEEKLYPYEDQHWSIEVDHAYGMANFGGFDLAFGKQPIAWGTSYVFNPTAKTYSASAIDYSSEETPGILALAPSLAFSDILSLQAYLAFQEQSLRRSASVEELQPKNLPFGARISAVVGAYDLSLSFIKEARYNAMTNSMARRSFLGADFAGALWVFDVYGEAALGLPRDIAAGTGPEDLDFERDLDGAAGFSYKLPGIDLEFRCEYYYHGAGADDRDEYDVFDLLTGKSMVLGKHYLFGYASLLLGDYCRAALASLVNLADGSLVVLPALTWDAASDFTVELSGKIPLGSEETEFAGEYDLAALGLDSIDILVPTLSASVKLSF